MTSLHEPGAKSQTKRRPFRAFASDLRPQSTLRTRITDHHRAPEPDCVTQLLDAATQSPDLTAQTHATALRLVKAVRGKGSSGTVEGLLREYDLSSQEGVALMCLAEALLRIPDRTTRDALIRDKIGMGDWQGHVGRSPSLFVNAATWALVITGKLTGPVQETGLVSALSRLIARGGEPLIRNGVDMAMRLMGEEFVTGQTIAEALANSRRLEAKGFTYSYDMLGEAATTAADADQYFRDYERAIHAIGAAARNRGVYEGPGISIKLSAIHPRYSRLQRDRVMRELYPRLLALTVLARGYDIGLNIDAEEADRLELSLDLLEKLCCEPQLAGWDGIGFVVQTYQKRAIFVVEWVIDLARRTQHRLMIRLVKGAYWDSEIKRAQVDGLEGFPVFTRKLHTDVSYLACARTLLAAPDAVFPQFATHNAYTVSAIVSMAGADFYAGQYEFQCLHGMGEPLYEEVVGRAKLNRPCRIYAPVGTHESLLAYLVRRLLENGANSSFVNQLRDPAVPIEDLIANPAAQVAAETPAGLPHDGIRLPQDLYAPLRANAVGFDLTNEHRLATLAAALEADAERDWRASPANATGGRTVEIRNPADRQDLVGHVIETSAEDVDAALTAATAAASSWGATPAAERAACLIRGADLLEARLPSLLGLIVREAGKSFPNAVSEVREAVDFMRYYATEVMRWNDDGPYLALGVVACISPWNFPLAIFVGQVSAALAAGNAVLAKPAEETPLIAAAAVDLLHEAGVPVDVLRLVPGQGDVGRRIVGDVRTRGVLFTGSTEVARLIARQLADRLNPNGAPVPLIAETGGQNALVVDSSALAEQVVADVLVSAFDSAGQRCSALRVLCIQEDVADRLLTMLRGALAELFVGNPDRLSTDIGPVITDEARDGIEAYILAMRAAGHPVYRSHLTDACTRGTFVAPAIIELDSLSALEREVFGPVLHVVRYKREDLDRLMAEINATGYGLTFGVHTRIDETMARVTAQTKAGNVYVNRNLVGAVVGVQPFGGHGLSGTGPKAGGPLYLRRLLAGRPANCGLPVGRVPPVAEAWTDWLTAAGEAEAAAQFASDLALTPFGAELILAGPVGEHNAYKTAARGSVLCVASDCTSHLRQIGAVLATGNRALLPAGTLRAWPPLPPALTSWISEVSDGERAADASAILFQGLATDLTALSRKSISHDGPIVPIHVASSDGRYPLEWLVAERSVSINTTAAGGNTTLMMIGSGRHACPAQASSRKGEDVFSTRPLLAEGARGLAELVP